MYRLSEHIYVLPYDADTDRPNLIYVKGEKSTLLYDAGCGPKTVKLLKEGLEQHGLPMPEIIALSHYHWDHSFASGYLQGQYISSAFTAEKMQEMIDLHAESIEDFIDDDHCMPQFCREHMHMEYADVSEIRLRVPEVLQTPHTVIDLGGVHAELLEVISPHCEGQIILYVPEDRAVFLADAFSALIYGHDFIDDKEKRKEFYRALDALDYETAVMGHFDPLNREAFLEEAMERLK